MRLPLQTIRFRGGQRRQDGHPVLAARQPFGDFRGVAGARAREMGVREARIARVRRSAAAAPARDHSIDDVFAKCGTREQPAAWGSADDDGEFGLSAKYGITSTITLDATVNPDFSQVESDAFQVEVNQRFPIFFSEKRPFFMEGAGIFTLAGEGQRQQPAARRAHAADRRSDLRREADGQRRALHVRHADRARPGRRPESAATAIPIPARIGCSTSLRGQLQPRSEQLRRRPRRRQRVRRRVQSRRRRRPVVARERHAARQRFRAGVIARGRRTRPTRNRAWARRQDTNTTRGGSCWSATASTTTADFEMQTAFINRVGITSGWGFAEYSFYPDKAKYPWIRRISPFSFTQGGRDRNAGGNELLQVSAVRFSFTRQGFSAVRSIRRVRDLGRASASTAATGG